MNTYQTTEPVVVDITIESTQPQEPTLTDKAKEILQQVGEKIGIVQSPLVVPVSSPSNLKGPLAEIKEVRAEMGLSDTMEQQKPLSDRAKETLNEAGEKAKETLDQVSATIEPIAEKVKDSLYQAGETLGLVQPVQNIEGPLAEIQDVRQDMGKPRMDQPIQKPLSVRAKETLNEAGERAKETWNEAGERAKETWNEAGERMEPYAEKAKESLQRAGETLSFASERVKETWNEAGERIEPYAEKAKESLYQAGESIGIIKPVQNIEGPLAEIQDVREDMGKPRMEQPFQKPLTERAKESWNEASEKARDSWYEAGERIEPYVEKSKESLHQAGETLGFIKPVQNIEGPLAEIQDVREDMGKPRMEQPIEKPLSERAKETWNEASEKAKDTWNEAGERMEPYAEKAKETWNEASLKAKETWNEASFKARETWNEAGERMEPYAEKAKETWNEAGFKARETLNEAGERMEPYAEKAKDTLNEAGEKIGLVKPAQKIEGPLAEIQDVRQDMGKPKMEQPYQKPLTQRAKETWNEAGEKAKEAWNEAGQRMEPYTEIAKEKLNQAGEQIGFANNPQDFSVQQTTPFVGKNMNPTSEKIELYAENAGDDFRPVVDEVGNITGGSGKRGSDFQTVEKTKIIPENTLESSTKTLPA